MTSIRAAGTTITHALFRSVGALTLALAWVPAQENRAPAARLDYADYPVASFQGHPAKPKFKPGADTWPDGDPRFRENVEFYMAKGANFAGAYTVVQTTCGTGCSYVVIVDVRSGHIFENLPFRVVDVGGPNEYRGVSFRLDSRLLIVEGLVGSHIPTRSYYEWRGSGFRLIKKVDLIKPSPNPVRSDS